jgi:hypothetical protein
MAVFLVQCKCSRCATVAEVRLDAQAIEVLFGTYQDLMSCRVEQLFAKAGQTFYAVQGLAGMMVCAACQTEIAKFRADLQAESERQLLAFMRAKVVLEVPK